MLRSALGYLVAGSLAAVASAGVVEYDWDLTWVTAAPDGFSRPVIGVNNEWPCPEIRAVKGDTIRVKMNNLLGNQTASLHFHGINQISTNWMDGPSLVTQCPVPPGESMTYEFLADEAGTYWWHSHNMGQYPDGLRGAMIIEDPDDPYKDEYDEEHVLTISDWFHEESLPLGRAFLNPANPNGIPPLPKSLLLNDGKGADYTFEVGKNYRFRIINMSGFSSAMIHFDSHDMNVIMNDASYIQQEMTYQLRITPAQRYDVIIKGIDRDNRNFGFLVAADNNRDYTAPGARWGLNATGWLVMDPEGERRPDVVEVWRPHDDSHFKPLGGNGLLPPADKTLVFNFEHCPDSHGILRHCVNGSPYVNPKVPTLYTAATTGEFNTNETVYGAVHPFIVDYGDIVDIVVNNRDAGIHPFHLHGHHFQVVERPGSNAGDWGGPDHTHGYNRNPPRRDTVSVMPKSRAVLRFEANNPGVYLFHCHIEWHVEMGLTATIIEAPDMLRDLPIPEDHIEACRKSETPWEGNAGGNRDDPLDTSGIDYDPPRDYHGAQWTPRGPSRIKRSRIGRLLA